MKTENKEFHIDKKLILITGIVIAVCIIAVCAFVVTGSSQRRLNSLLDAGNRYLSELDYEEAVAVYLAAIAIDPKCEDAYLGLADAYVAMGDLGTALESLSEGYEWTESERIAAKMEEVNLLLAREDGVEDSNGGEDYSQEPSDEAEYTGSDDMDASDESDNTDPEQSGVTFVPWADAGLEDHVMEWGDEALERNMRDITGIEEGEIMLSDVWEMTDLYFYWDEGISDITALGELTNLTELRIFDNQISDISPLGTLTNLTYLNLGYNQISDISSLSTLTNLTYLDLDTNQISDVSSLNDLTSLTVLNLFRNQISDVSSLSELTNLTELDLSGNQISDVSPLSELTNLTILHLEGNNIIDFSPLDHFPEGVVWSEW